MRALVTGGAGFIGSNLVDTLVDQGHHVTVIDNLSATCNDFFYFNDHAMYHVVDVCDYDATRVFYDNVDWVFHLAAESRLQPAIENPIDATYKNVVGTTTALQCSREAGVKRFVYSSTSSGYGNNPIPNIETQPDDCLNPYSVSKVAAEKMCKMYFDLYGLETVILRYFNVFGPRAPQRGQYALVTGIFLRQMQNNEPLTIVGDGSQRRDFIHVIDVAEANILAASASLKNENLGQVYNIGSGSNISIKEIADAISRQQTTLPLRAGEMHTTLSNIDKARRVLGWTPNRSIEKWIGEKQWQD